MAAIDIDERKLRSVMPAEDSSPWYAGFQWGGAILGCAGLVISGLLLILFATLRGLF